MQKATKKLPSKKRRRAPKKSHTVRLKPVQTLKEELKDALEQQTATSEILRVIANSPTDLQPVLDAIAQSAARVCGSDDAHIYRIEGDKLRRIAWFGSVPRTVAADVRPMTRGSISGRAVIDQKTIHLDDLVPLLDTEFPESKSQRLTGARTVLATPMFRKGLPIGAIVIRRTKVQPFSDNQIARLETFADQAVIAIENVRPFSETKEALEQQTATGDVLRVIAGSPTELQPVLDTVIESAVRLSGATQGHIRQYDGEFLHNVANYNVGVGVE